MDTCKLCPEGKYQNVTGQTFCELCPGNTPSPEGSASVTECACPPGQQSNADNDGCVHCPAGKVNPTAGEMCVLCESPDYQEEEGMTTCSRCLSTEVSIDTTRELGCVCKPGFGYAAGPPCAACDVNTYSSTSADLPCTQCPAGKWTAGVNERTLAASCVCKQGYGAPNELDATECDECKSGKYAEGGTKACRSCGDNTVSPDGSLDVGQCQCNAEESYYQFIE